jgi:transglycosylase-like protein with SLT domain
MMRLACWSLLLQVSSLRRETIEMRPKSFALGIGLLAAATGIVAAARPTTPPPDVRVPGVLVVATRPTVNDILDIVLGKGEEARVAAMLSARTTDASRVERITAALMREAKRANLQAPLLVGVLLTENPDLEPRATSAAGARGLMQVMPFHAGHWGCPSTDLFDIDSNICHGVRILADNLRHSRDLRSALLRYNGCVRGTNTPDCYLYAAKVYGYIRRQDVN